MTRPLQPATGGGGGVDAGGAVADRRALSAGSSLTRMTVLVRATGHLDPPFAVIDLDAFDTNVLALQARTFNTKPASGVR